MLIEIKNVSVIFGTNPALNELSVELEGGAIGLLGPNGAGKSTLIKMPTRFCSIEPRGGKGIRIRCENRSNGYPTTGWIYA